MTHWRICRNILISLIIAAAGILNVIDRMRQLSAVTILEAGSENA